MPVDTKKVAIGAGIAGAVGALIYFATRAKAAPPLPPPGLANLYGRVTDSVTGKAISDVLVALNGVSTYTDSGGNYVLTDLEPRSYQLAFAKEGYETAVY